MNANRSDLALLRTITTDVAVIGGGPAGIVTSLQLAGKGVNVCILESGKTKFLEDVQRLGDAAEFDAKRHAPMDLCTRRMLGGATNIWGGRIVPYDPVDFATRDYIPHSRWPINYEELTPYFGRACDYFRCGKPNFNAHNLPEISQKSIIPNLRDGDIRSSDLERWSLPTNFKVVFGPDLKQNRRVRLETGFTSTQLITAPDNSHVTGVIAASLSGEKVRVVARAYIIACGALETTRLLMNSGPRQRGGLGNSSGMLGSFYMGHISGRIARVRFNTDPRKTHYGFRRDRDRIYVRQRFTFSPAFQQRKRLTNMAMWLVNPPVSDASHRNGVLSFVYLALRSPLGKYFASEAIRQSAMKRFGQSSSMSHWVNILRDFPNTAAYIPSFGFKRFCVRRKVPGFFQYSAANTYDLHYHGEQIPNPDSRVKLSDKRDDLGMRRLSIDFRYTDQDVDSVVKAHQYLDEHLQKHGVGKLEYLYEDPVQAVWDQAADGYHQAGTTRMAKSPSEGVVDENCRVHGMTNLFIASSSTFVTSSQANTTFLIVVQALRLADHLVCELPRIKPRSAAECQAV